MSQTVAPVRETDSSPVSLRRVFVANARSEWTKLRTVRSTIWALTEIKGLDPLLYSFAGLNLAQLSIGVLGVLVMTSEYSTRTIKLTFAAAPQRTLLLSAKVATFSAVVAVVGLVSCFAAFWVCQALLAPKHAGLSISDSGVLRAVIGGALHLVLVGAMPWPSAPPCAGPPERSPSCSPCSSSCSAWSPCCPRRGTTTSPDTCLTQLARPCPPSSGSPTFYLPQQD
jgi:hypothetical protein